MIEKMAFVIVSQMGEAKLISQDMKEYYIYALITMIERWITVGTIIVIGLFCKQFIPTLFFLGFFLSIRGRTGGYHADTFLGCYFGTILTYLIILRVCPILEEYSVVMYGLVLISVIVILYFGTVNHPNMDMNAEELEESKSAARWLVLLESMIVTAISIFNIYKVYVSYMSIAIILCAVLVIIAKIKKQEG